MTASEASWQRWVPCPAWEDEPENGWCNDRKIGTRVIVLPGPVNAGRTGTVIGYGRGLAAQAHHVDFHEDGRVCPFGEKCDYLADSEGPVIRFDDLDPGDETLDWYPGQAMGCLEALPVIPDHM